MNRPACTLFCIALAASAAVHARTLRDAAGQPLGGGAREWPQRGSPQQPQQQPQPQPQQQPQPQPQPRPPQAQPQQQRSAPERGMELHSGPLPHPPGVPPIAVPAGPPPQTLPVPHLGRAQPGQDAGERNWPTQPRREEPGRDDRRDDRQDDRNWQRDERQVPRVLQPPRVYQPQRAYQWRDYDRFRTQHFRLENGRYFGRTRYQVGPYLWPRGFGVRLWLVGDWLPTPFYADNQYLIDYWRFGLYEPPPGCRWVRVGSDALLVDDFNGEVLDGVYNLFW